MTFGWLNNSVGGGEVPRSPGVLAQLDPSRQGGYVRSSALASSPVKAGSFVVRSLSDGDGDLSLPSSPEDVTARGRGIALVPHDFEPLRLAAWQWDACDPVVYLSNGYVWVLVEAPVLNDGAVFARFAPGPGGSELGALRGDSDGGTCAPVAKAKFRTNATRYALVELNRP